MHHLVLNIEDKENWRLAKKLDPKNRIFAPVIVRGEESEGVQMWEFGKEIYEAFLQMLTQGPLGCLLPFGFFFLPNQTAKSSFIFPG